MFAAPAKLEAHPCARPIHRVQVHGPLVTVEVHVSAEWPEAATNTGISHRHIDESGAIVEVILSDAVVPRSRQRVDQSCEVDHYTVTGDRFRALARGQTHVA